jgi:hypothetical protein
VRPFRERAGVRCRGYSRALQRALVDFGADESFRDAVEKVREHYGIEVSPTAARRLTQAHGTRMAEEQQAQRVERLGPEPGVELLITELDGSQIPIVEIQERAADRRKQKSLQWREARLCLAREPGSVTPRFGACVGEAEEAGEMWLACVARAGAGAATQLHCLGDGAAWISQQAEQRFGAQASFLLDFYHVSQYLAGAAEVIAGAEAHSWLRQQQARLKENRASAVLAELLPHIEPPEVADEEARVRVCHRYLTNHREQLDYRRALEANLPIGSGEIESGHRYVVQARLKIAGAWWKMANAPKMLALRVTRANHQWESYWQQLRQAVS